MDDKIIKQWSGVSLEQIAAESYTFYHLDQKFVLKWVIADPDSDQSDIFTLESNGTALSQLEYLDPNFKMVEEDPEFFDATVYINNDEVNRGSFEWRAGTLSHKIAAKIHDA